MPTFAMHDRDSDLSLVFKVLIGMGCLETCFRVFICEGFYVGALG